MATIDTIDSAANASLINSIDREITKALNNRPKDKDKKKRYSFDCLKMLFCEPYTVTKNLTVYEPKIGDILRFGEKEFYKILNIFISHTTQYRVQLWDTGIDWNKISDYELFRSLISGLTPDKTGTIFGDVDFTKFRPVLGDFTEEELKENEKLIAEEKDPLKRPVILINEEQDIFIDEKVYEHMAEYLRTLFGIFPKVEKAKGRSTKISIIEEERSEIERSQGTSSSFLFPLVSALVNYPGFKYNVEELRDVGIFQFMDSVNRIRAYEQASSLNSGAYSGMCDLSKIDKKLFDFMRDLNSDK